MSPGSSFNVLTNISTMITKTHTTSFHSGIRRIFCNSNLRFTTDTKSKVRCFHTALQGARNMTFQSSVLASLGVGGKRCQSQAYKSVVYHVQKECRALFRSSTSTVEEEKSHSLTGPLTKLQAHDLIMRLTGEERTALLTALQEFQSEKRKAEYEDDWQKMFADVKGKWSLNRTHVSESVAESVPVPNTAELWRVVIHNAVPFVGFGFLDNFVMIIAGDQIEMMLGSIMVLSTMAAAALGNTISDVMGIGSAWYVERMAVRVGMQPPKLSPIQLDMPASRRAANMGRVLGVVLGCLLGMTPLLFLGHKKEDSKEEEPT